MLNKTKLVVGSVAAITGRDINVAVAAAHIAAKYNTVNKSNAGTIEEFISIMNNSPSKSGTKVGKEAEEILINFSNIGNNFKPNFVTFFNNANARYIYTEKGGGWIWSIFYFMQELHIQQNKSYKKTCLKLINPL